MYESTYNTLVVGAGYAGSVLAERLASQCEQKVLVIDQRDHIAGNAFDYYDDAGVLCHRYGPHIFHTRSQKVWNYLSGFTSWRRYEHRVLASVCGQLLPIPISRDTINRLYGLDLSTEKEVADFLARRVERRERVETSEDAVVTRVGRQLYELFFRGYTRKQWALDPSSLHASVCARIPVRHNADDRYFTDQYQAIPADGYTTMFERILDHPGIDVALGTRFEDIHGGFRYDHLIYTGPIDAYYGYRFGRLPYRSLRFEHCTHETPDGTLVQPVATVNYPSEQVPWTRTTEFRHITGQVCPRSTIAVEYPEDEGHPYYPVPRAENRKLYRHYEALARREKHVTFVGRLARYQYLNMDQVVGQALATFNRLVGLGANVRSTKGTQHTATELRS